MAVYLRVRLRKAAVCRASFIRVAQRVLISAGEPRAELSVELVGDRRMRQLNRMYRKIDRTTDVLAFAMREAAAPDGRLLGDVVISLPTARRQAQAAGHSIDQEVAALLVHGVLHLCGYDHERSEREARRMARREQAILRRLGRIPRLITGRATRDKRSD